MTNVYVNFTANPGEWYWLQYTDTLSPANWQNVGLLPTIATNLLMTLVHQGGAGANQRFYRLTQLDPEFGVQTGNGAITSLVRNDDATNTQYLSGSLGAVTVKYGVNGTTWSHGQHLPVERGDGDLFHQPGRNDPEGQLSDDDRLERPAGDGIGFRHAAVLLHLDAGLYQSGHQPGALSGTSRCRFR